MYPKEIVIKEMQHRYKITYRQAETLYSSYEKSNELDVLTALLFPKDKEAFLDV